MTDGPIKASGQDTGGAYALLEFTVPPDDVPPPLHVHHRTSEAFYVISGTLMIRLDDKQVIAPADSFVLVRPGVSHTFAVEGSTAARFLVIVSPPELLEFFKEMWGLPATAFARPYDIEIIEEP